MLGDAGHLIEWTHDATEEEAVLLGVVDLFGVHHHVMAIQVQDNDQGVQEAVKDPYDRLGDACHIDDTRFQTVELPGRDGAWVLVITPHGD